MKLDRSSCLSFPQVTPWDCARCLYWSFFSWIFCSKSLLRISDGTQKCNFVHSLTVLSSTVCHILSRLLRCWHIFISIYPFPFTLCHNLSYFVTHPWVLLLKKYFTLSTFITYLYDTLFVPTSQVLLLMFYSKLWRPWNKIQTVLAFILPLQCVIRNQKN